MVVNCSGVFRDLFINQMALIDQAVKMAAEADEPLEQNFVRKHALEQAEKEGTSLARCGLPGVLQCQRQLQLQREPRC